MGIKTSNHDRIVSEPNIVPLIDVLLVLIIIFMVIAPVVPAGFPAVIPQPADRTQRPPAPNTVVVQVLQGGQLKINREPGDWTTLGPRLSVIFAGRADKAAFIQGAGDVPFAQIARALDIMRGAGIRHIGLITASARATKSFAAPSIR